MGPAEGNDFEIISPVDNLSVSVDHLTVVLYEYKDETMLHIAGTRRNHPFEIKVNDIEQFCTADACAIHRPVICRINIAKRAK